MWRLGVLLLITALFEFAAADVKPTDSSLIQRLRRSPPNECDNNEYYQPQPPRPRFWPPPPPRPPFGPPFWPPHHHRHHFEDFTDDFPKEPCSTCGKDGQSSALSNAKSENGDAIAVAVSKGTPNKPK